MLLLHTHKDTHARTHTRTHAHTHTHLLKECNIGIELGKVLLHDTSKLLNLRCRVAKQAPSLGH